MATFTPSADRRRRRAPENEAAALVTVAIVGRPNVGKSTLFNRLVGRRLALVDDQPGVTRDLREGAGRIGDLRFTAIDTAGLEDASGDDLPARMRRLTERAVEEADICLFVIDSRAGVTATDQVFAEILRKSAPRIVLAANKVEGRAADAGLLDAFTLGLGEPVAISAEHGEGMGDLYAALEPLVAEVEAAYQRAAVEAVEAEAAASDDAAGAEEAELAEETADDPERAIRIAVIGRPNAGKSTLVNKILGEERLLTGPEAGITRDAIGLEVEWGGRKVKIFDTAGLRRRAKVQAKLEKLSVADALRAARFAEVAVLLIDVQNPLETQDLKIADLIETEGRAVVIAVNKWDLEPAKQAKLAELKREIERLLPQIRGAPVVALSAETGAGIDRLREAVFDAYASWNIRVSTAKLNRWLALQSERHPPPAPGGRRIKLRYMTQAKSRPPTFVVFASKPDGLPESYRRYLTNALREDFKLAGTPIRMIVKATENPFAGRAKKKR